MTKIEAKEKLKELLFTKSGTFNPHFTRTYDKWMRSQTYLEIKKNFLNKYITDKPLNDPKYDRMRIHCFMADLPLDKYSKYPVCIVCKEKEVAFRSISEGFSVTCPSRKCMGQAGKQNKQKSATQLSISSRKQTTALEIVNKHEVKNILLQITDKLGKIHSAKTKSFLNDSSNYNKVLSLMKKNNITWLKLDVSTINEILYCIDNNIKIRPKCSICKKNYVSFRSFPQGYSPVCLESKCQKEYSRISAEKRGKVDYQKIAESRNKIIEEKYNGNKNKYWEEISNKRKETLLKKYGVEHQMHLDEIKQKVSKKSSKTKQNNAIELFENLWNENFEIIDVQPGNIAKIKCKKCGNMFSRRLRDIPICPICEKTRMSKAEKELGIELHKLGIHEIETNVMLVKDSKGNFYEADIFLPEYDFAIEYNGLFYHKTVLNSDDKFSVPKDYHIKKSLYARNADIFLVHIWEDWWTEKRDCVLSYLSSKLDLIDKDNIVSARNCKFEKVSTEDAKIFLNEHHLDGFVDGTHYALITDDKIISMMTIRKNKQNLEIKRYCTRNFYTVNGGFNKLLTNVLRDNHEVKIISSEIYIDLNNFPEYSVYYNNGFKILNKPRMEFDIYPTETYYLFVNKMYKRVHWQNIIGDKVKKFIPQEFHDKLKDMTTYQIADLVGGRIHTGFWTLIKEV